FDVAEETLRRKIRAVRHVPNQLHPQDDASPSPCDKLEMRVPDSGLRGACQHPADVAMCPVGRKERGCSMQPPFLYKAAPVGSEADVAAGGNHHAAALLTGELRHLDNIDGVVSPVDLIHLLPAVPG